MWLLFIFFLKVWLLFFCNNLFYVLFEWTFQRVINNLSFITWDIYNCYKRIKFQSVHQSEHGQNNVTSQNLTKPRIEETRRKKKVNKKIGTDHRHKKQAKIKKICDDSLARTRRSLNLIIYIYYHVAALLLIQSRIQ